MIRLAGPDDAGPLAGVQVETWRHAYRGILADDYLDAMDPSGRDRWWRRRIEQGATVLVAEAGDGLAGFCWVGPSGDEGWGEVYAIYVHPERWGKGHGRRLIRAGESSLRRSGFSRALLWVLEENRRARDFYERQGWRMGKPFRIEEIGGTQVAEVRYEIGL